MFFMSVKRFMFDFANLLFNVQTGIITTNKKTSVSLFYILFMAFIKKVVLVVKYIIEIRTQKYCWRGLRGLMEREKAGWLDR